jgi:hypothetical protein
MRNDRVRVCVSNPAEREIFMENARRRNRSAGKGMRARHVFPPPRTRYRMPPASAAGRKETPRWMIAFVVVDVGRNNSSFSSAGTWWKLTATVRMLSPPPRGCQRTASAAGTPKTRSPPIFVGATEGGRTGSAGAPARNMVDADPSPVRDGSPAVTIRVFSVKLRRDSRSSTEIWMV